MALPLLVPSLLLVLSSCFFPYLPRSCSSVSDFSAWMGSRINRLEDGSGLSMKDCDDDNADDIPPLVVALVEEENLSSISSPNSEDKNKSQELNACECLSDMAILIGEPSLS